MPSIDRVTDFDGESRINARDFELGGLEEFGRVNMRTGAPPAVDGPPVPPLIKDRETMASFLWAGEQAQARPVTMAADEVGLDWIVDRIGDARHECDLIEDDNLVEAALEDRAVDLIDLIDARGGVAQRVLHEVRYLPEAVFDNEVEMVAHLAHGENAHAGEDLLRFREPKAEDLCSLLAWQKTKLGAVAPDGDVE